ncbi:MAG: TolC family protein [Verrucomicrobiota bacterium]
MPVASVFSPRRLPLALVSCAILTLVGCAHHDYAVYEAKPIAPEKIAAAFDARSLDDPGLRKFLTENLHRDFSTGANVTWDFENLCWVAFYFNPTLDVARAQWETARASIKTAGERPNPTLTLTPGFSANPGGASPWLPALGGDLIIETAGKRDLRGETARLNAEAARQTVFAAAWQVRGELRRALLELSLAENRATQARAVLEPQQKILDLLEQRRAAGAGTAAESATARLALIRAEAARADAERQVPPARQRAALALGLPAARLARLPTPELRAPVSPTELAAARRLSLQSRADVLAALARYAAADSALALEIAKQHPDIHLGPGYQWDQGQSKWTLGLTLELPLFNRNEGAIAEAVARRREAAAEFTAAQAQVLAEIDEAAAALTAASGQTVNLRRVQAELENQRTGVESRLKAGVASQLDLETARLETTASEQALAEAANQTALAAGQLEDALQIPLANLGGLAPAEQLQLVVPIAKKSP